MHFYTIAIVTTIVALTSSSTTFASTMTTAAATKAITEPTSSLSTESKSQSSHSDDQTAQESDTHIKNDPFQYPLSPPSIPVKEWPHQSVLLQAGVDTKILANDDDDPVRMDGSSHALPIGIPIEFETAIFRGQFLVRLRNVTSDDPHSHDAYFQDRHRVMQTVIQGRFKKSINMADLYVGCIFREPMKYVPPPFFMRMIRGLFRRMAPGTILDFASEQPRILALYAGAAKAMRVDLPGHEPDMASTQLTDCVINLDDDDATIQPPSTKMTRTKQKRNGSKKDRSNNPKDWSLADRKRFLSSPEYASHYQFDTDHIYTMEVYDEAMDYGKYEIKLPIYGNFNFSEAIGSQPMTFTAATKNGDVLYDFALWHESILQRREILTLIQ
jgi:Protein of unknown function (DUF1769)